jgi:hypothetical protein
MDYINEQKQPLSVTAQAMVGRQMEEVKAMVFMAKQFPRDEQVAINRILKACERKTLAESAMYEYPRGGQKITGPSIRLAETIAQNWTNIDFGINELEQRGGESIVMAYAWDVETNTRQTKTFTVKHERKAKGIINRLEDPRDIYELVANQGARRVRACILGIVPGDVVEAAVEKCKETMAKNIGDIKEHINKMIKAFEAYKVTPEMLEKFIGCKIEAFSANDLVRLGGVYNSLKDGMAKPEQYFEGVKPEKSESTSGQTKLDEKLKGTANVKANE